MGCTSSSSTLPSDVRDFDGELIKGKREGHGVCRWRNGDWYDGMWKNDRMEGRGVLHFDNDKCVYTGSFHANLKHGPGVLTTPSGKFEGQFQKGFLQGPGVATYKNTDQYIGDFERGKRDGRGVMEYHTGEKYTGAWADDERSGKGKLVYKDDYFGRDTFQGDWLNDKRNGQGVLSFVHGGYYRGEWRDDQYHGKGELVFANGDVFTGTFVKGRIKKGRMRHKSGEVYDGEFRLDQRHGHGTLVSHQEGRYVGSFVNGKRHGQGTVELPNGLVVTAVWRADVRQPGPGTVKYPNGCLYEGNLLANNQRHGFGSLLMANGNRYVGQWRDDQMEGDGKFIYAVDADGNELDEPEVFHGVWRNGRVNHGTNLRLAALKLAARRTEEALASAKRDLALLRQDSMRLTDQCAVCHDAPVNSILLDCRHCNCCYECAQKQAKCPKCAAPIVRAVRTFNQ
eukprot:TRINITY_DN63609_c0_g1_i2.p1 TRINITY_DN63609_c0_g1~~TRINITY_DN63609_c0_g1_i2.p1  ORF type:complete len:453 (+),score=184.66 TRINITY_DN63609_c0_g1_i2:54-1412(+)